MQRYWQAPRGMDDASLDFQTSELRDWCKAHSIEGLEQAYRWLQQNYSFGHWPKISDWKKALDASLPAPLRAPSQRQDFPWIEHDKRCAEVFEHGYAKTPLANEMRRLMVFQEYRAATMQAIRRDLRAGGTGYSMTLGGEHMAHLRKRGAAFVAAAEYRQTPEYIAVHGMPFDFSSYRRPKKRDAA